MSLETIERSSHVTEKDGKKVEVQDLVKGYLLIFNEYGLRQRGEGSVYSSVP